MSPFHAFVCSRQEVTDVYSTPLMDLVYSAATVHRMYNDPTMVSKHHPAFLRYVLVHTCRRGQGVCE
jgi:hypothetical protein